jgi:hypothetical protein
VQPATRVAVNKSPCTEKCSIADHKLLTGGGLLLMADISPDMSASIPPVRLAVSDVERVSRDLSGTRTVGLLAPGIVFVAVRPISEWRVTRPQLSSQVLVCASFVVLAIGRLLAS